MDRLSSDSDWESSSDSGSSDGTGELEFLYGGHADNLLSSLEETIEKIDDFLSFEREFARGDIVRAVRGPCEQMGKVINVNIYIDLENVHGKTVKNIRSNELLKIRPMSEGDYVVHGPWVGKVNKIVDMVSLVFDDGTKCEVLATDQAKLVPLSPNILEDFPCLYYPGQRIHIGPSAASRSSSWLCGTSKENHNVGTVAAVKAGQVDVHWIACALVGCESFPAPRRSQNADNLILLSSFPHENWHLGEWCMLPGAGSKGVSEQTVFEGSVLEIIKEHHNLGKGFSKQDCHPNLDDLFTIAKMKTMVDVLWQNGCCSTGLDSESLLPVDTVNAHEFWPGQFVLHRCTSDNTQANENQTCGVVSEVDATEQTVKVKWKPSIVNDVINQEEEIVSAYELVEHPDYSFCFGDVVFKNTENVENEYGVVSSKASGRDHIDYPYEGFLSCIGCITGLKNGRIKVTWASGQQTEAAPSDIFRLSKYEGSTSPLNEHEGEESLSGVVDHAKQMSGPTTKEVLKYIATGEEAQNNPEEHASFSLPQFPIGFFKGVAASLFRSFCSTSNSSSSSTGPVSEVKKDIWEVSAPSTEMQPFLAGEAPGCKKMTSKEVVNDVQENEEYKCMFFSSSCGKFQQFDMVVDCSDHQFLDGQAKGSAASQVRRGWLKKVQQEWSTLEKDLPESIYVRIYEDRMDLLRAAIVGAPGTPYHDGLFFFDIYLPPEYPHEPPLVHYHSGGLRVNPNLYESGKVCLSLLNTWQGTGSEVWNPESSSILQVLLSLQALVLNDKPYFNEAGYDKQIGRDDGERNSVSYNENAFLLTWKSMLYLLHQPPKHFEALVKEHVMQHAPSILSSCKAYLEGAPVATAFGHGHANNGSQKGSSTGFKIMLAKLLPKLVETFSDKGVDCSGFAPPEK